MTGDPMAGDTTSGESLHATLDRLLAGRAHARVLDAGCGPHGRVTLRAGAHIVGLDISAEQLAKNQDVHEKVLGDIQTYEFPPQSFDAVIWWELLEHVQHPERALALAAPNVFSIKGPLTKFTPYRFHRWYYQRMYGIVHPPIFPTHLRLSMTPRATASLSSSTTSSKASCSSTRVGSGTSSAGVGPPCVTRCAG